MKRVRILVACLLAVSMLIGCRAKPPAPVDTPEQSVTDAERHPENTTASTESEIDETDAETDTQAPSEDGTDIDQARLDALLSNKTKLRFDENGEFKIMMLSDLHLIKDGISTRCLDDIKLLVEHEHPNLIILNGDILAADSIGDEVEFRRILKGLTDYFEDEEIYWIHVYGNHDREYEFSLAKQHHVYKSYPHCLSKAGDLTLHGLGNYVLPLYGSRDEDVKFIVWALDSGGYLSKTDQNALFPGGETPFPGNGSPTYDYIHSDQIEWYVETSKFLQEQNGGEMIPGLMAFHIPLQETYTAWINREGLEWTGQKGGDVGASPYNSGFFEVLRRRGDVKIIVNGHDHANDFMVNYAGIKLCYTSTVTTTAHCDESIRGTRLFIIRESNPVDVETYMTYLKDLS